MSAITSKYNIVNELINSNKDDNILVGNIYLYRLYIWISSVRSNLTLIVGCYLFVNINNWTDV